MNLEDSTGYSVAAEEIITKYGFGKCPKCMRLLPSLGYTPCPCNFEGQNLFRKLEVQENRIQDLEEKLEAQHRRIQDLEGKLEAQIQELAELKDLRDEMVRRSIDKTIVHKRKAQRLQDTEECKASGSGVGADEEQDNDVDGDSTSSVNSNTSQKNSETESVFDPVRFNTEPGYNCGRLPGGKRSYRGRDY
jgi:hypothetical protein